MNAWQTFLYIARHGIGRGNQIAIAAIICGLAIYWLLLRPAQMELRALQQATVSASTTLALNNSPRISLASTDLDRFYAHFRSEDVATDWLARIYDLATQSGVDLKQGDYQAAPGKEIQLAEIHAVFSMYGSYVQIRTFVSALLSEIPILSVDQLRIQRQKPADTRAEGQISITLFIGAK